MLAQSFMTHTELGVTAEEHTALIKVLGMLERGELVHDPLNNVIQNGFNMGKWGQSCGTTACIGGWVAAIIGVVQCDYVCSYRGALSRPIHSLYWPKESEYFPTGTQHSDITTTRAAFALRSFMNTGKPNWAEAMA